MIPNPGELLMTRIELAPGVVQYQFPPREDKHYGFSLVVLLNEESRSALLIDTGYEEHAAAVLADLVTMDYALKVAVISHFHPDHILGLQALPKIDIIGSPKWEETLLHYGTIEELKTFVPTQIASRDTGINFGRFHLDFRPAAGHAPAGRAHHGNLRTDGHPRAVDGRLRSRRRDRHDLRPHGCPRRRAGAHRLARQGSSSAHRPARDDVRRA